MSSSVPGGTALSRDKILYLASAVVTALLAIALAHGWLSPEDFAALCGVVAAFNVAWHIPSARMAESLRAIRDDGGSPASDGR